MRYAFIGEHRSRFHVDVLCATLEVSRSGYYEWRGRAPSARAAENVRLLKAIREIHIDSRENYGEYKTWKALQAHGEHCGLNRVARLRRCDGLIAKRVRLFRRAYAARNPDPPAPNLLERDFTAQAPNRVWVTDITFVPTRRI